MGRWSWAGAIAALLGVLLLFGVSAAATTGARVEQAMCRGERATIVGSAANDRLQGTDGRDVIAGLGGSDRITGRGGRDLVCGGAGEDVVSADLSGDRIYGGPGSDTIDYSGGPVQVDLARGSAAGASGRDHMQSIENVWGTFYPDVLLGSGADNSLYGSWDDDVIRGRGGDDVIEGGENDDGGARARESLWGGAGNDVIEVGYNAEGTVHGGAGDDRITGAGYLSGGTGQDRLYGGSSSALFGGRGGDSLTSYGFGVVEGSSQSGGGDIDYCDAVTGDGVTSCEKDLDIHGCGQERPTIFGTVRSDTIQGTPDDDVIQARDGDDVIDSDDGDDLICTGGGSDVIRGGMGDDSLDGGSGKDRLNGVQGADLMWGGAGADHLSGGHGRDWLEGGPGSDIVAAGPGSDLLAGYWTVSCAHSSCYSNQKAGEPWYPADHGNVLEGGAGNDEIFGGRGNDRVSGGPGAFDTFDLTAADGQVEVNLATGTSTGATGNDMITGIEVVLAPWAYPATLIGDELANNLIGGVPANQIVGGGGDDYISVSEGNPHPSIWEPEWDSMVESARGGDGSDTLQGSDWTQMEELYGEGGDDVIHAGLGGRDLIDGGPGIDVCTLSPDGGKKRECEET